MEFVSNFFSDVASQPVFYLLSLALILCALMVVTLKNIFHCAIFLILALFTVAGLYILLHAEFLAAVQVLIYVGAVSVLMIFAIMLTSQISSKVIKQSNEQSTVAFVFSFLSPRNWLSGKPSGISARWNFPKRTSCRSGNCS